jgi:hypothetical protein
VPIVRVKRAKIAEPLAIHNNAAPPPHPAPGKPRLDASAKNTSASEIDTSGVRAGTKLRHKAFGNGIVHTLDAQHITVEFNGDKR